MWIKTINKDFVSISNNCITEMYTSGNGSVLCSDNDRIIMLYKSPTDSEEEAQEVLDYIWQRITMGKNFCDIGKVSRADAELPAKWPGCDYEDEPKRATVHRNFEFNGIPEASK